MKSALHPLVLLFLTLSACSTPSGNLEQAPVRISGFPSTVPGISLPNAHAVGKPEAKLFRGMAPWTKQQLRELAEKNVSEILIFRNDDEDGKTVEREINLLKTEPRIRSVVHVPLPWRDLSDFQKPCEQTIQALKVLRDREARGGGALYFHCTMGEDRTGYLAALYRVIFEGASGAQAFRDEMCRWGYADGGPTKPKHIADNVHAGLTKIYLRLVHLHATGRLRADNLNFSVCAEDPANSSPFREALAASAPAYRCR
ncbi:MAG: hypothetical protein EOP11_16100 [Proteobacteria bacterium]|nr:MAG: hypothetical protein EOP11_16100 [Pseudomonadota bacterium]